MKKLIFGLLSLSLLFTACKKQEAGNLSVLIEGTVYDAKTNAVIEGATVELTSGGATYTATTNANGYYSLGNFSTGVYTLVVSREGYLSRNHWADISNITVTENTESATFNSVVDLNPLSESMSFTVYKKYQNKVAATNTEYTLTYNAIGNDPITGTTSETGLVTLENLPYDTYCYISFNFVEDGLRFKALEDFYSSSGMESMTIYGYYENGDFGLVETNLLTSAGIKVEDFDTTAALTFRFTQPVDTSNAYISFSPSHENTWSESNMMLTVTPDDNLTEDTEYYFYYSLENSDNSQSDNQGIYFNTMK